MAGTTMSQSDRDLLITLSVEVRQLCKDMSNLRGELRTMRGDIEKDIDIKVEERVHKSEWEPYRNYIRGFFMAIIAGFVGFIWQFAGIIQ